MFGPGSVQTNPYIISHSYQKLDVYAGFLVYCTAQRMDDSGDTLSQIGNPHSQVYVEVGVNILVSLGRVEFHSLGLGVSISPFVALVSVELHS